MTKDFSQSSNPLSSCFSKVRKGCPSCLSPSARQAFPSAKRFSWFSMKKTIVGNCRNCLTSLVLPLFCFPRCPFRFPESSRKFFPIIGKPPKNFSNRWKKSAKFSNHWKKLFQSLENPPLPAELPDCAKPKGLTVNLHFAPPPHPSPAASPTNSSTACSDSSRHGFARARPWTRFPLTRPTRWRGRRAGGCRRRPHRPPPKAGRRAGCA